jgi:hypothetical protein
MSGGECAKQVTAADEIRRLCERVSEKSNALSKLADSKLAPLFVTCTATCELEPTKDARSYPPYFDGLRTLLESAIAALEETNRTINKVDI